MSRKYWHLRKSLVVEGGGEGNKAIQKKPFKKRSKGEITVKINPLKTSTHECRL